MNFYQFFQAWTDRRLARNLVVMVIPDEHEVVVSEPRVHIHGYGPTLSDALSDFRNVLVDTRELLEEDEPMLDPYLAAQLAYLRAVTQPAA